MNILFITYTRIGDAVLSTGLLSHLIETHPHAAITVACGPVPAGLFSATPNVVQVIAMPKLRFAGHWRRLWAACIGRRWDVLVDLRNSAMPYVLRARHCHVLGADRDPARHKVERLGALMGRDPPPPPRLWLDDAHRRAAMDLMSGDTPVLALAPCANWRGKQWPAVSFAEFAHRLTSAGGALAGAKIALFGASGERDEANKVLNVLPSDQVIDLVGIDGLLTVAACLERATLFVGNDSGLMHMAAAVGTPTVGLFGPSRDEIYAPWGEYGVAVRTPESFAELTTAPDYDHRTTDTLMRSLTVDAVAEAATRLVGRESLVAS